MRPIVTRMVRWALEVTVVFGCVPVAAQILPGPGHFMWLDDAAAATGDVVAITSSYTNLTSSPVQGWSVSVMHEPSHLFLLSAVDGMTTQTVKSGSPPDFSSYVITTAGWNHGVVICFVGCAPLPPGVNYELELAYYEVLLPAGETTQICYCDCVGLPPAATVVVALGQSLAPDQQCGTIEVPQDLFVRGDCNGDGAFDVADAVAALLSLFVPGSEPVDCADACDNNDDGFFNIADAVFALGALFVPLAPAVPAPAIGCGLDPTDDALDCGGFAPC